MSDDDDGPRNGGCAGITVLTVAALGLGVAVYAISSDAFVIAVWITGWALVVKAARKPVQSTPDPAPPPLPERGAEEKPQVKMVRDTSHPNRWIVATESPWMRYQPDKRDESWPNP